MYWLAEQGIAPKRVWLAIIPLIFHFIIETVKTISGKKGKKQMDNNQNRTIDVPKAITNVASNLSGNLAGGALLSNAFYIVSDLWG